MASGIILASCGGYSEEQGKAADDLCSCMENGETGDFDIDYSLCDMEINEKYDPEIFGDEGYTQALEEKCPDVASKFTEGN